MTRRQILVVDDEKTMREIIASSFRDEGFDVTTAESGEEALAILENEPIQLHFLDLQLPGMTGLELCRTIREKNPIAISIAMTGYVSVFHLIQCREAGFEDFIVKPFKMELLIQVANQAFEKLDRWRRGH